MPPAPAAAPADHRRRGPRVVTFLSPEPAPFETAVACEVFGTDRSEIADPWYEHVLCAEVPGPQRTRPGWPVLAVDHGLEALVGADTVIVPAWPTDERPSAAVLDAVRAAHRDGARLLSFCSGAFLFAAAGLLDGRRATTHWIHADELQRRHPAIRVDAKVLYVDDGDILTSAGTAAGIDLCLHVLRLDHGADVANAVARRMVVPPHRDGGQAQYVDHPVPDCCDDVGPVMTWALEHLDADIRIEDLARRAHMSGRTFARRFRAATGTSPLQWLLHQRVLHAQRLLEETDEPVERIAQRCGLGTAANLRLHFHRVTGASPQSYRRTFRGARVG